MAYDLAAQARCGQTAVRRCCEYNESSSGQASEIPNTVVPQHTRKEAPTRCQTAMRSTPALRKSATNNMNSTCQWKVTHNARKTSCLSSNVFGLAFRLPAGMIRYYVLSQQRPTPHRQQCTAATSR